MNVTLYILSLGCFWDGKEALAWLINYAQVRGQRIWSWQEKT